MNGFKTTFKKRLALVMVFFSIAPIVLFGAYTYEDLSRKRMETYENGFYSGFKNDMERINLWMEGKKMSILSDGKLHFLSAKRDLNEGAIDGRNYGIIREGTEAYSRLKKKIESNENPQVITEVVRINENNEIVDGRTIINLFVLDRDIQTNQMYFVKEEIRLNDLIREIEKALDDKFASYSVVIDDKILFTQNSATYLDPYSPLFNRGSYSTTQHDGKYYLGIYSGASPIDVHISAYRDYSSAIDQIRQYQIDFLLKIFMVGLVGCIFSIFIARQMNYPIQKLKNAVNDILSGDIESRIQVENMDEFGEIYTSFNQLAAIETDNYKKIVKSGHEIGDKNRQLISLNEELETSYEQLQEAINQLDLLKNKQETLINNIGELIWTMDEGGIVTFVNRAVRDKLGYSQSEFIGKSILHFIGELESGDQIEPVLEQVQFFDMDNLGVYFHKKDTEEKAFMVVNTKRFFEDNIFRGVQGFARTISDDWMIHHMTMRRNKEMEITGQISWVLANNILLDELLDEVVKKIEQLLHPDLCLIGLYEEGEIAIAKIGGSFGKQLGQVRLAMANDLFINLLEEQKIIRGPELHQSFRIANESVYEAIRDYVVLPLRFDQKLIGFFGIASAKVFSDSDLRVLQIIANQSAIAIDKAQLYKTLKEEYLNTIRVLATAVEAKDAYTEGHSYRVSKMAKHIAETLGCSDEYIEDIEISGILHDIGKIGIYDQILTKRGELTDQEYEAIKEHPSIGYKIIEPIKLSRAIIDGVLLHHKRYDRKGYPSNIDIEELPLSAGIIGVADAIDAMTSTRSYSAAKSMHLAMSEIRKHMGTQFHPTAAEAALKLFNEKPEILEAIMNE